jgi:hypothetical protein
MIASITKNNRTRHLLLIGGVACATTLLLLLSTVVLHRAGLPLITSVHAMGLPSSGQTLCVSAPTGEHCNNQDPIVQGCSRDAQTIAYKTFLSPSTGKLLAMAERRYSPTCHTYWGRIVEPVTGKRGLSMFIALKDGPPLVSTTAGTVVFTRMVFLSCQTPQMASVIGSISLNNGENPAVNGVPGLAAILAALPTPLRC